MNKNKLIIILLTIALLIPLTSSVFLLNQLNQHKAFITKTIDNHTTETIIMSNEIIFILDEDEISYSDLKDISNYLYIIHRNMDFIHQYSYEIDEIMMHENAIRYNLSGLILHIKYELDEAYNRGEESLNESQLRYLNDLQKLLVELIELLESDQQINTVVLNELANEYSILSYEFR